MIAGFILTDVTDGAPIVSAAATLQGVPGGDPSGQTDRTGRVSFDVPSGVYTLHVEHSGYVTLDIGVLVTQDFLIGPTMTRSAPGGGGGGEVVPPGESPLRLHPPDPPPALTIPRVEYSADDGVPHIRPEFFAPPEVGAGGGPWLVGAILAIDALAMLFGGGGGGESTDTKQDKEIKTLQAALVQLGVNIANASMTAFERDGRGLGVTQKLLGKILGPLINGIATLIGRTSAQLRRILGPVLSWIDRINTFVRRIYDVWLRPILRVIDAFRKVLRILELFHVKWAKQLDDSLGALERKLTAPILKITEALNEARDWIDRIVTLNGALQRVALIKGLFDNADEVLRLFWLSVHKPLTAAKATVYATPVEGKTLDATVATLRSYIVDGGGDDRARIDEAAQDLKLRLTHGL